MKIGLTGVSGFIGKNILQELYRHNRDIHILLRNSHQQHYFTRHFAHSRPFPGDLRDEKSLAAFCEDCTVIIHIAGLVRAQTDDEIRQVNIEGTRNLLQAAEKAGVNHFIYFSSGAVDHLDGIYAESKKHAEEAVRQSKVPWVILRLSEIYGPGDNFGITSLFPKIKGWPIFPVIGKGDYTLQPLSVFCLCKVIHDLLDRLPESSGKIIHLAGPHPLPFREIIETISNALDAHPRIVHIPTWLALAVARILSVIPGKKITDTHQIKRVLVPKHWDISIAQNLLGFSPLPFHEGLLECIRCSHVINSQTELQD